MAASPKSLLSIFNSFNDERALSGILWSMCLQSPFDWGLYGEDVVKVIIFCFRLFFIVQNSLALSQSARLTLEMVLLSSSTTWSEHNSFTSYLVFKGLTTVYRCWVVAIERKRSLPLFVISSNGPRVFRCRVISSALFIGLPFIKETVGFAYTNVEQFCLAVQSVLFMLYGSLEIINSTTFAFICSVHFCRSSMESGLVVPLCS